MSNFKINQRRPPQGYDEAMSYFELTCDDPIETEDEFRNNPEFHFAYKDKIVSTQRISSNKWLVICHVK